MPKIDLTERPGGSRSKKVRSVSLIATSRCNLACRYCYEKHSLTDKKTMELSLAKEVKRFCGAGHEMVVVDTNGQRYPCHRLRGKLKNIDMLSNEEKRKIKIRLEALRILVENGI